MKRTTEVNDERPYVYKVIVSILEGKQDPKELSKKVRQDCIEVLTFEGLSIEMIKSLLILDEKTLNRDLDEMNKIASKAEYLSRLDVVINVSSGSPKVVRKFYQRFRRLPNETVYKAVTRKVIKEVNTNAKHKRK